MLHNGFRVGKTDRYDVLCSQKQYCTKSSLALGGPHRTVNKKPIPAKPMLCQSDVLTLEQAGAVTGNISSYKSVRVDKQRKPAVCW